MPHTPTPWVGLAALVAMFVIPFLPDRLFEGPRATKHWPHRHICGDCGEPWTNGHSCAREPSLAAYPPVRGELRLPKQSNNSPLLPTSRGLSRRSEAR
jgi:hypothetical protein